MGQGVTHFVEFCTGFAIAAILLVSLASLATLIWVLFL